MIFFATCFYLVALSTFAEYPDGPFEGEVFHPHLHIGLIAGKNVSSYFAIIIVNCSSTEVPGMSLFNITSSGGSPEMFYITDDTDDYKQMISQLNADCGRNYQFGDFAEFTEVTPNEVYNVKVEDRALCLVVLGSHAEFPDGVFKGEVADPYLYIDITFHEDVPSSWVFIEVKCSRTTRLPPSSIFDIKDSGGSPKKFGITGDTDDYDEMISQLNVLCERNYQSGDFAEFTEVTPNKTYNVKVKVGQVAVTKTT